MVDYNKFKQALQHFETQYRTEVVLVRKNYSPEDSGPDLAGSGGKSGEALGYEE